MSEEDLKDIVKEEIKKLLADVIFTLSMPDISDETKFYMTGVKNSLLEILKYATDKEIENDKD